MKYTFPILLALLLILSGCEKEIPFNAEVAKPKLVLNALFTSDSAWAVHVSRSLSVLDPGELDGVFDADVRISDEAGNPVATLTHRGDGLYAADSAMPQPSRSYRISANAPGYDGVSASNAIPGVVQILQLDTVSQITPYSIREMDVEITFADPAGVANFYMVQLETTLSFVVGQDTEVFRFPIALTCTDPNIENEGGFDNTYRYILLRDPAFDGQNYSLKFSIADLFQGDDEITVSYTLSLISASEEFFNYRRSCQAYLSTEGNPFAQPVQVYSNVEGGFGIFAGGARAYWDF